MSVTTEPNDSLTLTASHSKAANDRGLPLRFGRYVLLRRLATGGMAELFLALQTGLSGFEKVVVIKRLLPSLSHDGDFLAMLHHEARIAAALSHPNIVQALDFDHIDGAHFLAMEHVHGADLRSIVRQMRHRGVVEFPLEQALAIVMGACAGLAHAHERRAHDGTPLGIVHRDVSPQNIVVSYEGDVKLVDFGVAKSLLQDSEDTWRGRVKGKVSYMSPEQARGETVDARSDLFSLGIVLFELTTGKRLFRGQSDYETLRLVCDREAPRPSEIRPSYPVALEAIVIRALSKDPTLRYPSARELYADLEEFVRRHALAVSSKKLEAFMQHLFSETIAADSAVFQEQRRRAESLEPAKDAHASFGTSPPPMTPAAPAGRPGWRQPLLVTTAATLLGLGGAFAGARLALTAHDAPLAVELDVSPKTAAPSVLLDGRPVQGPRIEGLHAGQSHTLTIDAPGFAKARVVIIGAAPDGQRVPVTLLPLEGRSIK
jgi:serine/threonine protein kinase